MSLKKIQALYGLKWNPFLQDIPREALVQTDAVSNFCWRLENLIMDGGFGLITGNPGTGKSAALRMVAEHIGEIRDVAVGVISRPQSGMADFYRELGAVFNIAMPPGNRYHGYKTLRQKWQSHIESTALRPVLLIDESQEMRSSVLSELRLLSSERFDTKVLLTVVFCGDFLFLEKLKTMELLPLESRLRTRLVMEPLSREYLVHFLKQALEMAGNPDLMTDSLITTLAEHAAGNYRSLMVMSGELLAEALRLELKRMDESLYLSFYSRNNRKKDRPVDAAKRRSS
jgi:general secretion pathway protein A